jgi:hypothetical protein
MDNTDWSSEKLKLSVQAACSSALAYNMWFLYAPHTTVQQIFISRNGVRISVQHEFNKYVGSLHVLLLKISVMENYIDQKGTLF